MRTTRAARPAKVRSVPEVRRSVTDSRKSISTARIGALAERQWGVVAWPQLRELGHWGSAVHRLVARGYLVRLHPGVFAVAHPPLRIEGRLLAAVFHAGSGSALSHTTAAWWWRLIDPTPRVIHVSSRHRPAPAPDIRVHRPRRVERVVLRRLPVTTVARTLLDLGSAVSRLTLRKALAEADHLGLLDFEEVLSTARPGHRGTRALRLALDSHLPELARARNDLEVGFILLIERAQLPMPEINAIVHGFEVDAVWRDARLVVELDGHATHANPVANEEDRRRELILRRNGFRVWRYTWHQVFHEPEAVAADVRAGLAVVDPGSEPKRRGDR